MPTPSLFSNLMNCTYQEPLESYIKSKEWIYGAGFALAVTIIATVVSTRLLWMHFSNYNEARLQRPITRILGMVPIYSISAFLSCIFVNYSIFFLATRDCYEAFVVYNFFHLFCEYLGPDPESRRRILSLKENRMCPPPMCVFNYTPSHKYFLSFCKVGGIIGLI